MTGPYRGGPPREPSARGDDGIVDDLVRQFADPLAFYRELVQNAIDAGTTRVEVELRVEAPGELRVSVVDDGEGMDADVVENALLVLFRSTKEEKSGKIGKFGVGFVSVFALEPRLVVVETKREGLTGLALHVHPDHRYELFEDPALAARGTAVRLHVPMPEGQVPRFADASLEALRRWCRHAAVPIVFRTWLDGELAPAREERVDGPFELDALVTATGATADGSCRAIVGLPAEGRPRAAFFNHGLTLYESEEPMLGAIAFKVQASNLGHTLSRDNVRRDESFRRALRFVDTLAGGPLVDAALEALASAAAKKNRERYGIVLEAIRRSSRAFDTDRLPLLLLAPCAGAEEGSFGSLGRPRVTAADAPSPLVEALGVRGIAVVDRRAAGEALGARDRFDAALADWLGGRFEPGLVARTAAVVPVAHAPNDGPLVAELGRELASHHRRPASIVLAEVHGSAFGEPCCAGGTGEPPWVLEGEATNVDPFRLLGRRPLVLNVGHPAVDAARRAAARSPRVAAQLLARTVLLRYGALSEGRCAALADALLEDLATGSGR